MSHMTFKGTVKNGVVVLSKPRQIPEGAQVEVEYKPPASPGDWIEEFAGAAGDLPPDLSSHLDDYLYGVKQ